MPLALQAKILRLLQEQAFERVGGNETVRTDVRLIAATHRDLKAWSAEGKFRPDLYYRLGVFTIHLPPLRERGDDLPLLVQHYLRRFSRELGREVREVAPEALERLRSYPWPGNIRELQSVLKQALLRASGTGPAPGLPARARRRARQTPAPSTTAGVDLGLEAFIRQRLGPDAQDLYAETHRQVDRLLLPRVLEYTRRQSAPGRPPAGDRPANPAPETPRPGAARHALRRSRRRRPAVARPSPERPWSSSCLRCYVGHCEATASGVAAVTSFLSGSAWAGKSTPACDPAVTSTCCVWVTSWPFSAPAGLNIVNVLAARSKRGRFELDGARGSHRLALDPELGIRGQVHGDMGAGVRPAVRPSRKKPGSRRSRLAALTTLAASHRHLPVGRRNPIVRGTRRVSVGGVVATVETVVRIVAVAPVGGAIAAVAVVIAQVSTAATYPTAVGANVGAAKCTRRRKVRAPPKWPPPPPKWPPPGPSPPRPGRGRASREAPPRQEQPASE